MNVHRIDPNHRPFGSYREAYQALEEVATKLKQGGPADIDALVADVARASRAHAFCKGRIDEVLRLLDAELAGPSGPEVAETKAEQAQTEREPWDDEPF